MDPSILVVLALFAFAILLRSQKHRDRIDWQSGGELLALAAVICFVFAHWVHTSVLDAAELSATIGRSVPSGAEWIAPYYDPAFFPVYIAVTAVMIDLLSRLARAALSRFVADNRRTMLWRAACANVLVFVLVPSVLYAWTAMSASSGSMLDDAAQDGVMPFIVAYAAPADWIARTSMDRESYRMSAAYSGGLDDPGRSYTRTGWSLRARLPSDAAPWLSLAVLLACGSMIVRRSADQREFIEYFVTRRDNAPTPKIVRSLFSTWRGTLAIGFTIAWLAYAAVSQLLLELTLGIQFIWLPLLVITSLVGLIGIPALIFLAVRSRRAKRS